MLGNVAKTWNIDDTPVPQHSESGMSLQVLVSNAPGSVLTDVWADLTHLRVRVAFFEFVFCAQRIGVSVFVRCSVIAAMWEYAMYLPKWLWWDPRVRGHVGVILLADSELFVTWQLKVLRRML